MDRQAAAALLGVPLREVRTVDENWIVTTDGGHYEVPDEGASVLRWVRTNPKQTPPRFHPESAGPEDLDEGEPVDIDGDGVPDGTAKQIIEWVGEDPVRGKAALDAERAKGGSARTSLVAALEKLAG
ncbi:MAG: hypothetical protein AUG49_21430 [Catenulispora sp. 13_1_20CM_3_70_7]|nr:MAG: hypothetical protein AUG49_21430 [Catenulispora sp. 13_1_20CM_3_70_7]